MNKNDPKLPIDYDEDDLDFIDDILNDRLKEIDEDEEE
jgi:hypothetical protein